MLVRLASLLRRCSSLVRLAMLFNIFTEKYRDSLPNGLARLRLAWCAKPALCTCLAGLVAQAGWVVQAGLVRLAGWLAGWLGAPSGLVELAGLVHMAVYQNLETKKKCRTAATKCTFFFGRGFCCCPLAAEPSKTHCFLMIRLACQKICTQVCGKIAKKIENGCLPVPPTLRA